MEEAECYLSLGSNLGDRLGYIRKAADSISKISGVTVARLSSVYETDPFGVTNQPRFLNTAVGLTTSLPPSELLGALKATETSLGRVRRERWREREIDIDIVFYDQMLLESDELTIPHPGAHLRRFVLLPIAEIAPEFIHPVFNKSVRQLLDACGDKSEIRLYRQAEVTAS